MMGASTMNETAAETMVNYYFSKNDININNFRTLVYFKKVVRLSLGKKEALLCKALNKRSHLVNK
jgi:hypothetical protein